jgi:hypothetical protein
MRWKSAARMTAALMVSPPRKPSLRFPSAPPQDLHSSFLVTGALRRVEMRTVADSRFRISVCHSEALVSVLYPVHDFEHGHKILERHHADENEPSKIKKCASNSKSDGKHRSFFLNVME